MLRISSVEPLERYSVRVELTDGSTRVIDLQPMLQGPRYRPLLDDMTVFRQFAVVDGTLSWPSGQDLDPDVLLSAPFARRVAVPQHGSKVTIGEFDGARAYVYPSGHACPPHVLLVLCAERAHVGIADGEVLEGALPARQLKAFQTWLAAHRTEVALECVVGRPNP